MTSTFAEALARNPAPPRKLGDVSLKYDPPLLVGTGESRSTLWPAVALVAGVAFGVGAMAGFLTHASAYVLGALIVGAGASFIANVYFEQRAVRRRAFVCHFAEKTLRLDVATAFGGAAQTLLADFEKVTEVDIVKALDGTLVLTVTFIPLYGTPVLRREVLIAFVLPIQRPELERLQAMLKKAFAAAPALPSIAEDQAAKVEEPGVPPEPVDTFTP